MPVTARWLPRRVSSTTAVYRESIDGIRVGDVIWSPFSAYRHQRPFEQRSLVSGFVRWGSKVFRYLPERVTRQVGDVQTFPRDPPRLATPEDADDIWTHWEQHLVDVGDLTPVRATTPGDRSDTYMSQYVRVSHPWASAEDHARDARPYLEQEHVADPAAEEPLTTVEQDMREIFRLAQEVIGDLAHDHPHYERIARVVLLARRHVPEQTGRTYHRRVRPRTDPGPSI